MRRKEASYGVEGGGVRCGFPPLPRPPGHITKPCPQCVCGGGVSCICWGKVSHSPDEWVRSRTLEGEPDPAGGPVCYKDGGKAGSHFLSLPRALLTCGHQAEPSCIQPFIHNVSGHFLCTKTCARSWEGPIQVPALPGVMSATSTEITGKPKLDECNEVGIGI